jgi:3-oxoacyl-[acyl-carrier-protein] synthase II
MAVVVTGIGLRSALGNATQTWAQLCQGRSGIVIAQPFPELPPRPLALIAETPQRDLAQLTTELVAETLADSGLDSPQANCAVVVGSSRGNQTQLEQILWGEAPIAHWPIAQLNIAAIATAQAIQTQHPVFAPMAACATGITAVARGLELIRTGQCDRVIAGAIDTPVTRLPLAGFAQMGALAKTGAYPFDIDREGFVLGEGGALFVLESMELARSRNAPRIYGEILGFGLTADAYHISSPEPDGNGATRAIEQALKQAQLDPTAIDYIHAHGTATQLNDATEAQVIEKLFPQQPWVSSSKGAIGHTLGGSSAIGIALTLLAMRDQVVPPCVGLRQSNFSIRLPTQNHTTSSQNALCNGFGFGGQNGAIVLSRHPL